MTAAAIRPENPLALAQQKVSGILLSESAKQQITAVLPHGMSLERVVAEVNRAVVDNPDLLECTPASLIMAVSTVVRWDLVIGETAHLVPFNTNVAKKGQAPQWEKRAKALRDWKGDIELVIRSGAARHVDAQCFYENEVLKYEQGTTPFIEHHPIVDGVKRGKMIGAYAWARIKATELKIVVMSVDEIDAIRQAKSQSWKNGPLPDWYARKTCVHQVTKSIPKNARLAEVLREFEKEDEEIPEGEFEVVDGPSATATAPAVAATEAPISATEAPISATTDEGTPSLEDEEPDLNGMTLEEAKATKLIGPPGSWQGKVGQLLISFSNAHLEKIRTWLREKIEERGEDRDKETMATAISLILEDRAKDQANLEFDSGKTADKVGAMQGTKAAEPKPPKAKLPF